MSQRVVLLPQINLGDVASALQIPGVDAAGVVPLRILSDQVLKDVARWASAQVESLTKRGLREEAEEAREIGVQCRIELAVRLHGSACRDHFRLQNQNAEGILAVRQPHPQGDRWNAGVVGVGERGIAAMCWADTREEAEKRATIVRDALNALAVVP